MLAPKGQSVIPEEEEDIALSFRKLGYKAYLVPDATFIHHVSKSSEKNLLFEKEFFLSTIYVLRKHYHWVHFKMLQFIFLFKTFRRGLKQSAYFHIFFFILRGAPMEESLRFRNK